MNPSDDAHWYERLCGLFGRHMAWAALGGVSEEFHRNVEFLGLKVNDREAAALAYGAAVLSWLLIVFAATALALRGGPWKFLLFTSPVVSLALWYHLGNYPRYLAEERRAEIVASMPGLVGDLAMSLRIHPNMELALEFAANRNDGETGNELKDLLWGLYTRAHSSAEAALAWFAGEWRSWNEDFQHSIQYLCGSMMEGDEDTRIATIDKGVALIYDGAARKMNAFAASLETPTAVLYFFGILLPLIFIAVLPLLSYVGASLGALEIFLAYCVAIPALVFVLSNRIARKRPITLSHPEIPMDLSDEYAGVLGTRVRLKLKLLAWFATLLLVIIGLVAMKNATYAFSSSMLLVWGSTLGPSLYLWGTTRRRARALAEIKETERDFIVALDYLGNRLGEGRPLETAIEYTGRDMAGRRLGSLLAGASSSISMGGATVRSALFDPEIGALGPLPSRFIRSTFEIIVDSAERGSEIAASTVTRISSHLKNMLRIEDMIKEKLSAMVETMRSTAVYFAPFIAGVVVVLQETMNRQLMKSKLYAGNVDFSLFEDYLPLDVSKMEGLLGMLQGTQEPISTGALQLILGIYLLELIVILTRYVESIRSGGNEITTRIETSKNLFLGISIFTGSIIVSKFFLAAVG